MALKISGSLGPDGSRHRNSFGEPAIRITPVGTRVMQIATVPGASMRVSGEITQRGLGAPRFLIAPGV